MASEGHIIQDERINNPWLGEEESGVGGGGGWGSGRALYYAASGYRRLASCVASLTIMARRRGVP